MKNIYTTGTEVRGGQESTVVLPSLNVLRDITKVLAKVNTHRVQHSQKAERSFLRSSAAVNAAARQPRGHQRRRCQNHWGLRLWHTIVHNSATVRTSDELDP